MEILFPGSLYCICCGNLIDETRKYSLCDHCVRRVKWDTGGPEDFRTLRPSKAALDDSDLEGSDTDDTPSAVNIGTGEEVPGIKVIRCCEYGIYSRTIIFELKYKGKKYIARNIADMMYDKLKMLGMEDSFNVIAAVPLSEKRERERGFNQDELIGKYLGKKLGIPIVKGALKRIRDTRPMKGLSPDERAENVAGAFRLDDEAGAELKGKRVLLIDDFYTTGATAKECIAELKKVSPESVTFYAFASRGLSRDIKDSL